MDLFDRRRPVDAARHRARGPRAVFKDIRASAGLEPDALLEVVLRRAATSAGDAWRERPSPTAAAARDEALAAAPRRGHRRRSPGTTRAIRALLDCIADPPPVLWVRGDADAAGAARRRHRRLARGDAVRAWTWPRRLGRELAERGARRRQRPGARRRLARRTGAALTAGGPTVAVLGCGLDVIYPAEHRELAARDCGDGRCGQRVRARARRRCPSTFRCGTASSAGSRWPSWSSKRPRRAGR